MSKVNVKALENIIRVLFSALNVSKMNSTEVDSIIDNLVDESSSGESGGDSPIQVEHSGTKLVLSGNFDIVN